MSLPPECQEIHRRLNLFTQLCSDCNWRKIPSMFEGDGCLAAHIILCILEAKSLHADRFLRSFPNNWAMLCNTLVFHDISKLTDYYHYGYYEGRKYHNFYSAAFVLELWPEGFEREIAALAIALHHEYRVWEDVHRYLSYDFIAKAPYGQPTLDEERVGLFINCLQNFSEVSKVDLSDVIQILKRGQSYRLKKGPKRYLYKFRVGNLNGKFEALAYLLQLIDNRAAFFREDGNRRSQLEKLLKDLVNKPEEERAEYIFRYGLKPYLWLGLLPKY